VNSPLLIPIATLFKDREASYLARLKSQRYALHLQTADDGFRVMSFLLGLALVEKFSQRVLGVINREYSKISDEQMEANAEITRIWQRFMQLCQDYFSNEANPISLGLETAAHLFHVGYNNLVTHLDKSAELPQAHAERDSLFRQLAKQEGRQSSSISQYDASVLINDPEQVGLPTGVTLSSAIQAKLGIVCSSVNAMLTSVGNAGSAPLEQFFMLRWWDEDTAQSYSLFEVLSQGHFEQLAKLSGQSNANTCEEDVLSWLSQSDSYAALLASLYVMVQAASKGRMHDLCRTLGQRLETLSLAKADDYQAFKATHGHYPSWAFAPATTRQIAETLQDQRCSANQLKGHGLKFIRLRDDQGQFHLATPLLNTGLLRDIQLAYYKDVPAEQAKSWRKLFCDIRLGGTKPQNSGTFFTAFMFMGQAKSLHCDIPTQHGDLRLIKLRLAKGQMLYHISRETALRVCARAPQQGSDWMHKPLSKTGQWVLKARLKSWVKSVQAHNHCIGMLLDQGALSPMHFKTQYGTDYIRAEHRLLLGCASDEDVLIYARQLTKQLLNKAVLTLAERRFAIRTIRSLVNELIRIY